MSEDPPASPDPLPPPEPPVPDSLPPPEPTCPRCLAPIRAEARYCPRCGRPVQEGVPALPKPVPLSVVLSRVSKGAVPGKQTIVFFVLWTLSSVIASHIARSNLESAASVQLGMQVFDAALTIVWVAVFRRDIFALYAHSRGGVRPYLVALLASYPVAFLVHGYVAWLQKTFSLPVESIAHAYLDAGFGWGVVFLSVCVQPPLIEELAFRGVIQTTLGDVMRPVETIVVAAIAFSIMHYSLVMFAPFVLLGAYLGWLRQWSGSLWPAMAAHFLHNSLVTLHEARPIFPSW